MKIQSVNPATEEVNKEFELYSKEHILKIAREVQSAQKVWGATDVKNRAHQFRKLADVLKKNSKEYGRLITLEMGKPIKQAVAEVEKCAWTAEVYAENGEKWLEDETTKTEYHKSFVSFEPLGVVLSIMPWNFPFWQAMRFGIPALTAGNATILRHSNSVPMCALAIEDAFKQAGFPDNVFRTILADHGMVKMLVKSDLTNGVSLTGSTDAGRLVGSFAAKNLKKFVLELGGSDPFVVLEDADIPEAAMGAREGRDISDGQSCIAAKRFIVVKKAADDFIAHFAELMGQVKTGDPFDENSQNGPLSNKQQLDRLESQVKDAVAKGASVEVGGKPLKINGKGYFYETTVLTRVKKSMKVLREECFGPVAPVIVVKDGDEAIKVANDTEYGLGASVWTRDKKRGEAVARKIHAGNVFVNSIVKSDPRFPFGGIKSSGIGRELSRYGLLEFMNIKTIIVK